MTAISRYVRPGVWRYCTPLEMRLWSVTWYGWSVESTGFERVTVYAWLDSMDFSTAPMYRLYPSRLLSLTGPHRFEQYTATRRLIRSIWQRPLKLAVVCS